MNLSWTFFSHQSTPVSFAGALGNCPRALRAALPRARGGSVPGGDLLGLVWMKIVSVSVKSAGPLNSPLQGSDLNPQIPVSGVPVDAPPLL